MTGAKALATAYSRRRAGELGGVPAVEADDVGAGAVGAGAVGAGTVGAGGLDLRRIITGMTPLVQMIETRTSI